MSQMNLREGEDDVSVVSIQVGLVQLVCIEKTLLCWKPTLCQMVLDVILDELDELNISYMQKIFVLKQAQFSYFVFIG